MAHIYAFGSVCRGEITPGSDIDLLAITHGYDQRFDSDQYSIYSYARIADIWSEGSPFAWHLSLEAKLLHSPDSSDYLRDLGTPGHYHSCARDCEKFFALFKSACESLQRGTNSTVFEFSTIFLAVRNFATCYSLGVGAPDFSRRSAMRLGKASLTIDGAVFHVLERTRLLSTRGTGNMFSSGEASAVIAQLSRIEDWMQSLLPKEQNL